MTSLKPALARAHRLLGVVCALALLSPSPLRAAELLAGDGVHPAGAGRSGESAFAEGASPIVTIGPNESGRARRITMSIGRSLVVELPRDAKEVFVANPKVANAVVRSTRRLFLIGLENGATSVFVMDQDGRQIATLEVNVGRDLTVLLQTLRATLPHAGIDLKPAGDSILLTGIVNSASEAQQATDIANAFVGVSGGLFGATKGAVINSLTIKGKDQVMLRVTVVEVARAVLKQFGIKTEGSWSALDFGTAAAFPLASGGLAASNSISTIARSGASSLGATLSAFERAGVSRVLAEPTLVAISGETATFTAGGEVPVPKEQICTTVGFRSCTTTTEYKPYGISLNFTPVVMSENRISLRINTEVTELDYENATRNGEINVPGMKVRRSATSVELPSGASMMTAGLLSQTMGHAVSGTPGLMSLPILGTLFRSRDYQRRETELMILVTPFIAKPMEPSKVVRPDDGFVESHDPQAILLGRLNKLYGVVGSPQGQAAYKGRFGFITD